MPLDVDLQSYCNLAIKALDEDENRTESATASAFSDSVGDAEGEAAIDEEIELEEDGGDRLRDILTPNSLKNGNRLGEATSSFQTGDGIDMSETGIQVSLTSSDTPRSDVYSSETLSESDEAIEDALQKAIALMLTLHNIGLDISNEIPIAELPKLFTLPEDAILYMQLADKYGKSSLSFSELGWILSETFVDEDE